VGGEGAMATGGACFNPPCEGGGRVGRVAPRDMRAPRGLLAS
jgi:hypothetical protein